MTLNDKRCRQWRCLLFFTRGSIKVKVERWGIEIAGMRVESLQNTLRSATKRGVGGTVYYSSQGGASKLKLKAGGMSKPGLKS